MSLWDNINKKRQRIKQGSGEKMRKKGDKGAPTPDQLKRAKGEEMEEGKMKQAMMRRQDMAKLAGLYSKAMKAIPGSPEQKKIKKQIDQYRRELGLNESIEEVRQPLTVPKSLAKYVVYKKSGIGKIKQVAHLRAMPKGKELDRVLDKYDADGVIAMSKIQRNKMQVEAVSPAQQAAIAISKKERGEKPKNEEVKYPHMMYSPDGKEVEVKSPEEHDKYAKKGYKHEKPEIKEGKYKVNIKGEGGATVQARSEKEAIAKVMKQLGIANRFAKDRSFMKKISVLGESVEESRAYRDAMRGLRSKSATRGMATTKKDKDTEASDDDRKAANKNIIMQLRKAADLSTGAEIEFERGKGKVSRSQAQAALARFNALAKPRDKEKFQKSIRSLSDIKKMLGR